MKVILILIAIAGLVALLVPRKQTSSVSHPGVELVMLDTDSQSTKYLPVVSATWVDDVYAEYDGILRDTYPNIYYDITQKLCGDVYSRSKYWENGMNHTALLNKLTKEQRVIFTLINFEGQVNNGGVYQFLFNQPELSLVALESMQIVGLEKLRKDYEQVLHEMFGKFESINSLREKFQNQNSKWEDRWNAFAEGYKELPSAEMIENYFYESEFKMEFQKKILDFVKSHSSGLFETEYQIN